MPAKVLDAERRKTEPTSPLTTAYGDPPIEVTCGVAPPAGMAEAQSQCFEVNGVGWFAKEVDQRHIFTTIGRKLYLELAVPGKYAPGGQRPHRRLRRDQGPQHPHHALHLNPPRCSTPAGPHSRSVPLAQAHLLWA